MKKIFLIIPAILIFTGAVYSQTVKGKIYYDIGKKGRKNASKLVIYLIPNTPENKTLVKNISTYEISCPEKVIKTAKKIQVALTDNDGVYFFSNIRTGSYLIKVCTYMGGYYSFQIKSDFRGTIALPDFEADPPVK